MGSSNLLFIIGGSYDINWWLLENRGKETFQYSLISHYQLCKKIAVQLNRLDQIGKWKDYYKLYISSPLRGKKCGRLQQKNFFCLGPNSIINRSDLTAPSSILFFKKKRSELTKYLYHKFPGLVCNFHEVGFPNKERSNS